MLKSQSNNKIIIRTRLFNKIMDNNNNLKFNKKKQKKRTTKIQIQEILVGEGIKIYKLAKFQFF